VSVRVTRALSLTRERVTHLRGVAAFNRPHGASVAKIASIARHCAPRAPDTRVHAARGPVPCHG